MENITFPELIAFWHKVTSRAKSLTYFCKGTKTRQKENNLQERTKHQGTHRPSSADWVCQSGLYKGWLAIAKLIPLSLFISLLLMPNKAFDNVKIEK